ncbi:kinase suppressor of Ras 2-like isoform X2 [Amphibalanus amphitrite]|uniref:kinase suppressor of Ras 2-like isoform X2 n=1 Tax=Amphibalanus amphitrite TaxID=1232801 RepID=UPI001C91678B|nr:kinase suppressor of Ras 2-like isoform X2 [Amphibalanus amphitrite]XP_043194376.1 kinase suppressor of Ras 2-like isoform X2 [Amphibalanus amphitrite]
MSEEDGEQTTLQAIEWCTNLQCLIEISAEHLEGLRTQCLTRAVLTQQEIRRIEAKLVKLFSTQLVAKSRIPSEELEASGCDLFPSLQLWLKVVGLSPPAVQMVCCRYSSMEALMESGEAELRALLPAAGAAEDEVRRLARAMHNMKKYTESQLVGEPCGSPDLPLYWDSWEATSPSLRRRPRSSVSSSDETQQSESSAPTPSESSVHSQPTPYELTQSLPAPAPTEPSPPRTPPASRSGRDGATPSASRRHHTGLREPSAAAGGDPAALTKSRSHESQLTGRLEGDAASQPRSEAEGAESVEQALRSPGAAASPAPSTVTHTPTKSTSLQAPRSPHTPTLMPGSMSHVIKHKFAKTFKVSTCDLCKKQMIYGLRCRECKYKCHRHCEEHVPPSCGLPRKYVDFFIDQVNSQSVDRLQGNASPLVAGKHQRKSQSSGYLHRKPPHGYPNYNNSSISIPAFQGQDSSSNTSSCNSSAPSSPAYLLATPPASASPLQQFNFPEVGAATAAEPGAVTVEPLPPAPPTPPPPPAPAPPPPAAQPVGVASQDSDKTMSQTSASTSTDSERTVASRLDSQDSTVSDTDGLPRQNSLSLREWDIPFEEVRLGDVVGRGRFGVVKKGHWHGEVAVKLLNMEDDDALEQFKRDVATFRKTRHENLVLFMGACMCPPQLAIITSFCKGKPLYNLLHVHKEKFNLTKISNIAKHISLGMGYLHARGIVHKDLKSKNIFVDNITGTVVITDFGLFSLTKLCPNLGYRHRLHIPKGWLCYLSPEIVRCLRPGDNRDLPFSMSSDIFAFGTVWYELLSGEWPWKDQPAEATIWLVGRGMKQSLANIQASRDVKDLLMKCWNYHQSERPDFTELLSILERLPTKRLARSPSHPTQLSRSVESVF